MLSVIWQIAGSWWISRNDAMADFEVPSKLVIFSNIIQSLICGLVGLLYLVLNEFGILCFSSLDDLEMTFFIAAVFLSAFRLFWDLFSMLVMLWFFFATDHIFFDLTWFNQEWWYKSAMIRLSLFHVLLILSVSKDLVNFMIWWSMNIRIGLWICAIWGKYCNRQHFCCILYNGLWGPSTKCE